MLEPQLVYAIDLEIRHCTSLKRKCSFRRNAALESSTSNLTKLHVNLDTHSEVAPVLKELINSRNYEGKTCLHLATRFGRLVPLGHLLQNGGNIDVCEGKSGRAIIHEAISGKHGSGALLVITPQRKYFNAVHYQIFSNVTCYENENEIWIFFHFLKDAYLKNDNIVIMSLTENVLFVRPGDLLFDLLP